MTEAIFPSDALLMGRGDPYLVRVQDADDLLGHVSALGAKTVEIDVASASSVMDTIQAMKDVLPFPNWCGSSWDSIEDAFQELLEAWDFPMYMMVRGFDDLLTRQPHVALKSVLRLQSLSEQFAFTGKQFLVVYLWANSVR